MSDFKHSVVITIKSNKEIFFRINSFEDFMKLCDEISKAISTWIFVGKIALLDVNDISCIQFMEGDSYVE